MYVLYIKYIYITVQYNYFFLMQYKCKRFTFIVLGTFHSDMTVVVLLHTHTQTLSISDCWHLILCFIFSFTCIRFNLEWTVNIGRTLTFYLDLLPSIRTQMQITFTHHHLNSLRKSCQHKIHNSTSPPT